MRTYTREEIDRMSDNELKLVISELLDNYTSNRSMMEDFINEHNIYRDILDASRGKRNKKSIVDVIGTEYEHIFMDQDNKLLKCIRNIQIMILTQSFETKIHEPVSIQSGVNKKNIKIIVPDFEDERILTHSLIRIILPILQKGMYKYTCACIPGRGIHYVRRHISRVISNDPKNTKYVLKMDIRKFFNSIPHRTLKKRLKEKIKDPVIRNLLFKIIDTTEQGLPLGFYTSQWLANFYLQPLDHYIKERILDDCGCNTKRTGRHGAVYYFRYMDDMVIFGPNKRELHKMREKISEILDKEYGLTLKYDW